ncbi:MAG: hypothetical protein FJ291_14120 [Planctomycetes bacterium]|nr:hypothetical protein [Planctomycetota bacterium]
MAGRVRYVGSVYHKDMPSFAGTVPPRRPHASICPRELARQRDTIQEWLRRAIRQGHFSALWEGGFARYVWHREGNVTFEARLVNRQTGEYKGFPLERDEEVHGLP